MAITVYPVGTGQNKNLTVVTAAPLSGWAAGDSLIVVAAGDDAHTSCRASYGFIFTINFYLSRDLLVDNAGNVALTIWSYHNISAAEAVNLNHFTALVGAVYSSAQSHAIALYHVRGLSLAPLDKIKSATGGSTTPSSTATATTSVPKELLIGGIGTEGPDGDAAGTWDGDTTENNLRKGTTGGGASGNITVAAAAKIVVSTGTYTASKTGITSRDWAAGIVTYKQALSPPGNTPVQTLMEVILGTPGGPS